MMKITNQSLLLVIIKYLLCNAQRGDEIVFSVDDKKENINDINIENVDNKVDNDKLNFDSFVAQLSKSIVNCRPLFVELQKEFDNIDAVKVDDKQIQKILKKITHSNNTIIAGTVIALTGVGVGLCVGLTYGVTDAMLFTSTTVAAGCTSAALALSGAGLIIIIGGLIAKMVYAYCNNINIFDNTKMAKDTISKQKQDEIDSDKKETQIEFRRNFYFTRNITCFYTKQNKNDSVSRPSIQSVQPLDKQSNKYGDLEGSIRDNIYDINIRNIDIYTNCRCILLTKQTFLSLVGDEKNLNDQFKDSLNKVQDEELILIRPKLVYSESQFCYKPQFFCISKDACNSVNELLKEEDGIVFTDEFYNKNLLDKEKLDFKDFMCLMSSLEMQQKNSQIGSFTTENSLSDMMQNLRNKRSIDSVAQGKNN